MQLFQSLPRWGCYYKLLHKCVYIVYQPPNKMGRPVLFLRVWTYLLRVLHSKNGDQEKAERRARAALLVKWEIINKDACFPFLIIHFPGISSSYLIWVNIRWSWACACKIRLLFLSRFINVPSWDWSSLRKQSDGDQSWCLDKTFDSWELALSIWSFDLTRFIYIL